MKEKHVLREQNEIMFSQYFQYLIQLSLWTLIWK